MAPRQWMRKFKVGKTGFEEAYKSVMEYRTRYPEKAVTFFSQQYPTYGWAILLAGGSLPNIPLTSHLSPLTSHLSTPTGCLPNEGCGRRGMSRHR